MGFLKGIFKVGVAIVVVFLIWTAYSWATSVGLVGSVDTDDTDIMAMIVRYGVMLAVVVVVILVVKALIVRCTRPGATYWVDKK